MKSWWQRWGRTLAKWVLAVVILVAVGVRFSQDINELNSSEYGDVSLRYEWLVLSAATYAIGLGGSAWFWGHLLRRFGQHPATWALIRAYYIGHLGKYIPGKAWALWLRGSLVQGSTVRLSIAIITAFYEVLTTMAAGALLAAVLFLAFPPRVVMPYVHPVWAGLGLLALVGIPLLPAVFNRMTAKLAKRFQSVDALQLPRLRTTTLAIGLAATACGWMLMGLSLWMTMVAVLPEPPSFNLEVWMRYNAVLSLGYVAGFLALVVPSGVGVREFILLTLLQTEGPGPFIALAVLLLRVVWTITELSLAGVLYWLPGEPTV